MAESALVKLLEKLFSRKSSSIAAKVEGIEKGELSLLRRLSEQREGKYANYMDYDPKYHAEGAEKVEKDGKTAVLNRRAELPRQAYTEMFNEYATQKKTAKESAGPSLAKKLGPVPIAVGAYEVLFPEDADAGVRKYILDTLKTTKWYTPASQGQLADSFKELKAFAKSKGIEVVLKDKPDWRLASSLPTSKFYDPLRKTFGVVTDVGREKEFIPKGRFGAEKQAGYVSSQNLRSQGVALPGLQIGQANIHQGQQMPHELQHLLDMYGDLAPGSGQRVTKGVYVGKDLLDKLYGYEGASALEKQIHRQGMEILTNAVRHSATTGKLGTLNDLIMEMSANNAVFEQQAKLLGVEQARKNFDPNSLWGYLDGAAEKDFLAAGAEGRPRTPPISIYETVQQQASESFGEDATKNVVSKLRKARGRERAAAMGRPVVGVAPAFSFMGFGEPGEETPVSNSTNPTEEQGYRAVEEQGYKAVEPQGYRPVEGPTDASAGAEAVLGPVGTEEGVVGAPPTPAPKPSSSDVLSNWVQRAKTKVPAGLSQMGQGALRLGVGTRGGAPRETLGGAMDVLGGSMAAIEPVATPLAKITKGLAKEGLVAGPLGITSTPQDKPFSWATLDTILSEDINAVSTGSKAADFVLELIAPLTPPGTMSIMRGLANAGKIGHVLGMASRLAKGTKAEGVVAKAVAKIEERGFKIVPSGLLANPTPEGRKLLTGGEMLPTSGEGISMKVSERLPRVEGGQVRQFVGNEEGTVTGLTKKQPVYGMKPEEAELPGQAGVWHVTEPQVGTVATKRMEAEKMLRPSEKLKTKAVEKVDEKIAIEAEKNNPLLKGESKPRIPGNISSGFAYWRNMANFIRNSGEPWAQIPDKISRAAQAGNKFAEKFTGVWNDITAPAAKNPELFKDAVRLLEGRVGEVTNQKTIAQAQQMADRLKGEFFDPIFSYAKESGVEEVIGKFGYEKGYVPMMKKVFQEVIEDNKLDEFVSALMPMMKNVKTKRVIPVHDLPSKGLKTGFLKKRRGVLEETERVLEPELLGPAYINGMAKTIFDIPAYKESMDIAKTIFPTAGKGTEFEKQVVWFLKNYIGQPSVVGDPTEIGARAINTFRSNLYPAMLGVDPKTTMRNLSQMALGAVENAPRNPADLMRAAKAALPKSAEREALKKAGSFREAPGLEQTIRKGGIISKVKDVVMLPFTQVEKANRGVTASLARNQALRKGLSSEKPSGPLGEFFPTEVENYINRALENSQFIYGKESPVKVVSKHPLLGSLASFPLRHADYGYGVMKRAVTTGKPEDILRGCRYLAYLGLMGYTTEEGRKRLMNDFAPRAVPVILGLAKEASDNLQAMIQGDQTALATGGKLLGMVVKYQIPAGRYLTQKAGWDTRATFKKK